MEAGLILDDGVQGGCIGGADLLERKRDWGRGQLCPANVRLRANVSIIDVLRHPNHSNCGVKRTSSALRQARIRDRLSQLSSVSIIELAAEFGVSAMTIRRDLSALESRSHVQRTHGGAILSERMIFEFDYRARREMNRPAKRAIAAEARKLVQSGQRLIIDTGTTALEFAALLKDGLKLTVLTPSLAVASELQHSRGIEVMLLGGVICEGSPDLTGPLTEHGLDLFAADWAFQGVDGISAEGSLYNADLRLARVDQIMRRVSTHCCILADHTKIGITALARSGSLADVDVFITSAGAPPATLNRFAELGPQVVVAEPG